MFYGFKSLWITLLQWQKSKADIIWYKNFLKYKNILLFK